MSVGCVVGRASMCLQTRRNARELGGQDIRLGPFGG